MSAHSVTAMRAKYTFLLDLAIALRRSHRTMPLDALVTTLNSANFRTAISTEHRKGSGIFKLVRSACIYYDSLDPEGAAHIAAAFVNSAGQPVWQKERVDAA